MNSLTIFDIANFFLKIVDRDSGSTITPLKLQKILYYAQGYHLAYYDKELFPEDFQAWAHGPANEEIYEKYKEFGFNSIPYPEEEIPDIDDEKNDFLNDIWQTFGIYDGKYLEEQTHREKPWIDARKGYAPGAKCQEIISKQSMKDFFKALINEQ